MNLQLLYLQQINSQNFSLLILWNNISYKLMKALCNCYIFLNPRAAFFPLLKRGESISSHLLRCGPFDVENHTFKSHFLAVGRT
jgi:hypothetical protein